MWADVTVPMAIVTIALTNLTVPLANVMIPLVRHRPGSFRTISPS